MIIEHAERFGLAQMHQLRGRVGRGHDTASCLLLYKGPVSDTARSRLSIMRESNDGFRIAEEDLRLRGPGEVLGRRQSGDPDFILADLAYHGDLLALAHDEVSDILGRNPRLEGTEGERLKLLLASLNEIWPLPIWPGARLFWRLFWLLFSLLFWLISWRFCQLLSFRHLLFRYRLFHCRLLFELSVILTGGLQHADLPVSRYRRKQPS